MDFKTFAIAVRLPFVTASALPVVFAIIWCGTITDVMYFVNALLCIGGVILVHIGANTINDYFDWNLSDGINRHAGKFNGGSRHLFEGKVSRSFYLSISLLCLLVLLCIALFFIFSDRFYVLYFALAGLLIGYLYSSPPFRFHSRGLGEFLIFLSFGPILSAAVCYVMTGLVQVEYFLIGVPFGVSTTAILWINQFPDYEADKTAGKHTLTVRMGLKSSRFLYMLFITFVYMSIILLTGLRILPLWSGLIVLLIPGSLSAVRSVFINYAFPEKLIPVQKFTIQFQMMTTIICIAGLLVQKIVPFKLP
jgi:1,4-dihydroxy-2-naphthoate octaprenyltransferase